MASATALTDNLKPANIPLNRNGSLVLDSPITPIPTTHSQNDRMTHKLGVPDKVRLRLHP